MIEAVVFDLDDVLAHYRLERRLALLAEWSGRAPDSIKAAIWASGFEGESERGLWSADDYLREFGTRMGYALTAAQWVEARRASTTANEPVLAIAQRVGERVPVGMFTNNGFLLKRHFADVYPAAATLFGERATFSADVGERKPEPEAFRRLAARLQVAPDQLLFFDDNASYVAGARDAGFHAHQYQDPTSLTTHLAEHGLPIEAR